MKNFLIPSLLFLIYSCATDSQTIFEWRGPDRSGVYPETNLLKAWPKSGPAEKWVVEGIGNGYGSPVIDGINLYVTGEVDSMAVLYCYNLDGKMMWRTELGGEWTKSYPGSRSAPTVYGDLLYVGTGLGHLHCVEKENGTIVWKKDFIEDFSGIYPMFGHSEAPVVNGDKVFWTPGGKEHNVVALDRFSGDLIWSNKGFGERSGYNQPKLIELSDRSIFVTFSAYHMMGFDTKNGEMLWSHEQDNTKVGEREPGRGDTHSNTVLYEQGHIYYAEGDGNGGVKLSLARDGSELTEIWRNKEFDSYMGGIVKIDNYLYGSGTAEPGLFSINAITGEIENSLKVGRGVVIAADDMIYYYNHQGAMKLISFDRGNMKEISSFRIQKGSKEHFSHPVICDGTLYIRRGDVLMAFNIASKQ